MIEGRRRRWVVIGSLGVLLAVTLVATWPMILHMDTHIVGPLGHPGLQGDLFFQWNIGRQMDEGGGVDYLRSPYTRYPEGQEFRAKVAFSLHLALYTVFMVLTDLLTARNLAVLLVVFLNAAAAWALARERFQSSWYAVVFALLFAFSPFVFLKLNQGFLQKATLFYLPFFALFFLRLIEHHRVGDAVASAFFLVVGLFVYPPSAVFTPLFGVALLLGAGFPKLPWRSLLKPMVVFALCVVPFVLIVLMVGKNDFVLAHRMNLDLEHFRSQGGYLDLFHPWRFFPYLGTFGGQPAQAVIEALPLGFSVLPIALGLAGAFSRRKYAAWLLAFSAVAGLIMAGPYLMRSGQLIEIGGNAVPLPLLLLDRWPSGQAFRFPIRMFPWLQLALLLAAGEGWVWLRSRIQASSRPPMTATALPLLVGALMLAEPIFQFPEYRRFRLEEVIAPSYCSEPCLQWAEAVLHLPYFAPGIHQYQFETVLCDVAMVNPIKRAPSPVTIPAVDASDQQKRAFLEELRDIGVGCIVVHPASYAEHEQRRYADAPSLGPAGLGFTGRDVEAWLEQYLGPPKKTVGSDVLLFDLSSDLLLVGAEGPHSQELVPAEEGVLQLCRGPQ